MNMNRATESAHAWGGKSGTCWQGGETKDQEFTVAMLAMLGVFAVIALSVVWGGFWVGLTLSVLWGWFAVPMFGLPVLTVWQAYGLALICFTLRQSGRVKSKDGF